MATQVGQFGPGRHLHDMTDITAPDVPGTAGVERLAAVGDEAAFAQLIVAHSGAMTRDSVCRGR